MAVFNDTRDWLQQAHKIDELMVLEDVDPHLEVGTIVQVNGQNLGPPSCLTN